MRTGDPDGRYACVSSTVLGYRYPLPLSISPASKCGGGAYGREVRRNDVDRSRSIDVTA